MRNLSLFVLTAISLAQAVAAAPPTKEFAIVNVTANMKANDVESRLLQAGFVKSAQNEALSYQERIAFEVRNARGSGPAVYSTAPNYQNWRKGGQQFSVWYNQSPGGPMVRQIVYEVPTSIQSSDEVATELIKRFGKPSLVVWNEYTGNTAHWCMPKTPKACDGTKTSGAVSRTSSWTKITLHADSRLEKLYESMALAEARKQTGGADF